ncbi:DUF6660 family protein [Lewinella sp. IMCC34191]|uniref:DUF6660 family protein n=1 Tax=Lewinella sp. IMCC34191 TaxID=2259172 RepID=UPI000E27FC06|nr:DUF6660 family protein [Lewinella sp. IMCC34191]
MRYGALSLAFYLVLLALTPCQDLETTPLAGCDGYSLQNDHDTPDHHDDCTPLCVCSCCGVLADTPPVLVALAVMQPLPPRGQSNPVYVPAWKLIDLPGRDIQPPRA